MSEPKIIHNEKLFEHDTAMSFVTEGLLKSELNLFCSYAEVVFYNDIVVYKTVRVVKEL